MEGQRSFLRLYRARPESRRTRSTSPPCCPPRIGKRGTRVYPGRSATLATSGERRRQVPIDRGKANRHLFACQSTNALLGCRVRPNNTSAGRLCRSRSQVAQCGSFTKMRGAVRIGFQFPRNKGRLEGREQFAALAQCSCGRLGELQRGDAGCRLPILGDDDFRIVRGEADVVTGAGMEFANGDLDCSHIHKP